MDTSVVILFIVFIFLILDCGVAWFIRKYSLENLEKLSAQEEQLKKEFSGIRHSMEELQAYASELSKKLKNKDSRGTRAERRKEKIIKNAKSLEEVLLISNIISVKQLEKIKKFQGMNSMDFENAVSLLGMASSEVIAKAKSKMVNL